VAAKEKYRAISPNFSDYPSNMSMYEKESLAAEAKLRKKKRPAKGRKSLSHLKPHLDGSNQDTENMKRLNSDGD
jgi:hypothetical protein